ncbi:LysE family translocator [Nocardiopsis coralliicola]
MDPHLLLAAVTATLLISIAPGPDLLFVLANGVSGGRRAGVVAALGMSAGLLVHSVAAAFGLGLLVQAAPGALTVVRIAGAVVLLFMAVTTWRGARQHIRERPAGGAAAAAPALPRRSLRRTFVLALLTNLANPKVILFFLAFMPQFATTGSHAWPMTVQMLVLGLLFVVLALAVDGTAGLLSGTLSERIAARPGFRAWMDRASAAVFGALGARLVLDVR